MEDPPPPQIIVEEELVPHVVAEDVSPAVVSEIKTNANRYPGVKIVELTRRTYPQGTLAAHVLGHLGPREKKDAVGQTFRSADQEATPADGNCRPSTHEPSVSAAWAWSGSTKPCWRRIRAWPSSRPIAAAAS